MERTNAWNGRCRRNSKDYERRTESSEAMIQISNVHLMLRRLSPTPTRVPLSSRRMKTRKNSKSFPDMGRSMASKCWKSLIAAAISPCWLFCRGMSRTQLAIWKARFLRRSWKNGLHRLKSRPFHVFLPKFKLETTMRLGGVLASLGMKQVFDPKQTDLSRIHSGKERLYLGWVLQRVVYQRG